MQRAGLTHSCQKVSQIRKEMKGTLIKVMENPKRCFINTMDSDSFMFYAF